MPEGHLVSASPLCQPCSIPQGQAESGGMVLVAYAGSVRPAAALRDSVLCLPTDIHSLLVNKPSSSTFLLFLLLLLLLLLLCPNSRDFLFPEIRK